jgi:hypothetical protein
LLFASDHHSKTSGFWVFCYFDMQYSSMVIIHNKRQVKTDIDSENVYRSLLGRVLENIKNNKIFCFWMIS